MGERERVVIIYIIFVDSDSNYKYLFHKKNNYKYYFSIICIIIRDKSSSPNINDSHILVPNLYKSENEGIILLSLR